MLSLLRELPPRRDQYYVFCFAIATRVLTCALLDVLPRFIPSFDASADSLLERGNYFEGFLRWDVLHFVRIAQQGGYRLEKDFAFMPGVPAALKVGAYLLDWWIPTRDISSTETMLMSNVLAANLSGVAAALILHCLTFAYTGSASFSKTTALLYSIPPAAYVLSVPLTEPYFAVAAFLGLYSAQKGYLLLGSMMLMATTALRANGLFNVGFIWWHALLEPWHRLTMRHRVWRLVYAALLSCFVALPFAAIQQQGYTLFCNGVLSRPWCFDRLPMIYTFVQEHYWNNGLFRYWTVQQMPLFVLSAPVLAMSFAATWSYYRARGGSEIVYASLPFFGRIKPKAASAPLFEPALMPAIHLHTFMTSVLLFASHVQICLRQASTSPVLFWFAAHLLQQKSPWGRRWVIYCIVYGALSIVLWANFLPPA